MREIYPMTGVLGSPTYKVLACRHRSLEKKHIKEDWAKSNTHLVYEGWSNIYLYASNAPQVPYLLYLHKKSMFFHRDVNCYIKQYEILQIYIRTINNAFIIHNNDNIYKGNME